MEAVRYQPVKDDVRTEDAGTQEQTVIKWLGRKRCVILVVGALVILVIILAITLGVVLNRDNDEETLQNKSPEYPVILISFDGFRDNYLTRGFTPNINSFARTGVQARFLIPAFPTKTFTSHYSIVTGLFAESHGIVFNKFYDPVLVRSFKKSKKPEFWYGEPIWDTAKKNGLKSASYFWVGSEVEGRSPTYTYPYKHDVPFSQRVEQVIKWLQLPKEERPMFISLYVSQPDIAGHLYGPDSNEVNEQLKVVDDLFGELLTSLDKINILNSVNIILVSDHGMTATDCNKIIRLDQYGVTDKYVNWTNIGSVSSLNASTGNYTEVLKKLKCKSERFQAFYKGDLPKRLHFSNNRRIGDIIVLGNSGELVAINSETIRDVCENGSHGYDNILPDMRAIFMARGPSFVKNKIVEHFCSIEIYNLLAALLKIRPAPNNGSMGSLHRLLRDEAKPTLSQMEGDGNVFRKDICQFPSDHLYMQRSHKRKCYPCRANASFVEKANKMLNLTSQQADVYQAFHLPWGLPDGGAGVQGCLMTQPNFIIGYSTYLRIPLWTANRVNGNLSSTNIGRKGCFREDVRLLATESARCSSYKRSGFDRGHMVPSGDLDYDLTIQLTSYTLANVAPQYPRFNQRMWRVLENKVRKWAISYKEVFVITGSIFDADENGVRDDDKLLKRWTRNNPRNPAIPTHFYKIVTRCDHSASSEYTIPGCAGSLHVISFILKNSNDEYCSGRDSDAILLQNVARIRDIELLTGSSFFSGLPSLQLQVEMKTFLPVQLWP